jgi:tight adherence protein C
VPLIKILKFKIFIDYTEKLNNILKIFYFNNYIKVNAYNFIFIQFVCMLLGFIISFFMFGFDLIFVFCLGLVFLILPYLKIYEEYNKINSSIVRQIPDVANLLSIMVYSGIDFNASLNKIIKILDGYLIKELEFVTEKVSLGIDIKIAFEEMAKKYNLLQLNTFVKAINMSLDTGTGLCDSLLKIAEQINKDNVSAAEKKAHEAPIKMLIPMTLLVLPTIFILLFAPFVLSFLKSGSIF